MEVGRDFLGRTAQLALLDQALSFAVGGRPQVVLVTGEAGVGKSRLVHHWLHQQPPQSICHVRADLDDSTVELATADQLLAHAWGAAAQRAPDRAPVDPERPSRPRSTPPSPSPPSAGPGSAGKTGAGPDPGPDPGFPPRRSMFDVGVALLHAFAERQHRQQAGIIFVDDIHWADPSSLTALGFATRRLRQDRIVLIAAARAAELPAAAAGLSRLASDPTGSHIHLDGLNVEETAALAAAVAGRRLDPVTSRALHEATRGNPLWVRSVAERVSHHGLAPGGELPTAATLTAAVRDHVERCTPEAQQFLSALAVLAGEQPVARVAALSGVADIWAAIDGALASGLIACHGGPPDLTVAFTHPVMAPAVEGALSFGQRHQLHRVAASSATSGDEELRHLIACAPGPDPALAERVVTHGRRLASRGSLLEASGWIHRATALTSDPMLRDALLLESAHAALAGGFTGAAAASLSEGHRPASGYRDYLNASLAWLRGEHERARAGALAAANSDDERAKGGAAFLLAQLALVGENAAEAVRWGETATTSSGPLEREAARAAWGAGLLLKGAPEETLQLFGPPASDTDPQKITQEAIRGLALTHLDRPEEARAALSSAEDAIRRHNQYYLASVPLANLGNLENRCGNWAHATLSLDQALAYAETLDEHWCLAVIHALSAFVPAMRAEVDVARDHLDRAFAAGLRGGTAGQVYAHVAAVQAAHAEGDREGVLRSGAWIAKRPKTSGAWLPGAFQWAGRYVEALVDSGDAATARDVVRARASNAARPLARSSLAEAQGIAGVLTTAAGRDASAHFAAAARLYGECGMPLDAALAQLRAGLTLRSRGEPEADTWLHAAAVQFQRLGANAYTTSVRRELDDREIPHDTRRRLTRSAPDSAPGRPAAANLTSQESVVARLVADGHSNKEVAAQMMLSVRTVEFHLASIFRKLGIRSRTQLVAHQLADRAAED